MRWRSPRLTGTALAAVLMVALSVPAAHAAADGPSSAAGPKPVREEPTPFAYIDAATRARMPAQEPLRKAAARIRAAVAAGDDTGFAGLSLAEDHVQVWWKGGPPREVREALAGAARLAPVWVGSAPHSLAELKAAARPLRERMAATRQNDTAATTPSSATGSATTTCTSPGRSTASAASRSATAAGPSSGRTGRPARAARA
ncbi:hypothetical protein ACQP2K_23980 [Microbispora siamensis]